MRSSLSILALALGLACSSTSSPHRSTPNGGDLGPVTVRVHNASKRTLTAVNVATSPADQFTTATLAAGQTTPTRAVAAVYTTGSDNFHPMLVVAVNKLPD